jgi:hypothetical protein
LNLATRKNDYFHTARLSGPLEKNTIFTSDPFKVTTYKDDFFKRSVFLPQNKTIFTSSKIEMVARTA